MASLESSIETHQGYFEWATNLPRRSKTGVIFIADNFVRRLCRITYWHLEKLQ